MFKKRNTLKAAAVFAAGLLLFSCEKTPQVTELSVNEKTANFEVAGGDKSITVTSNADWTVSCPADWVTISPKSGSGDGSFKISVTANGTFDVRSADVTVVAGDKTQTVKVNQLGLSPALTLDKTAIEAEAEGGDFDVAVTSNATWTVTIPADATWLTADKASGNGNGTVKFTVAPSDVFEARSAEVTFTYENQKVTLKVSQKALAPALSLSKETIVAPFKGMTDEVDVVANVAWTVEIAEDCDWITVDKTSGTGDDKLTFTIAENGTLKGRSTTIQVNGDQNLKKTIAVTQEMATPSRKTDSLILVAFFNISDGASWKSDRVWDLTKPMNEWYGITLKDGRVSALKFLKGTITKDWTMPADLADLTELTDLRFIDCKVNGSIPEELYGLAKLNTLYLTNNKLTGTLSEKVGQWTEMANIYIDQNPDLGGELPKALGTLKKLVNLNVSKTSFSGTIPTEITGCESLKNFMAYSTKFSGEVPDFWDQLASLELVQLYDIPTLTGGLPASFGRCKKLKNIYMYDNNLTGNIPEAWADLPSSVINVRVQGNKLKGVVPASIQAHANWARWKPEQYILPQQEGYGLTLNEGSGGQDLDNPIDTDPWN